MVVHLENAGFNQAPWYSCYISLTSTLVGSGILGLPHAFAQTGWILGTAFLILCSSLACYSLHLQSESALKTSFPSSYHSVAQATIPSFSRVVDLCVTVKGICVASSYLIVVTDSLPLAFDAWDLPPIFQNRWFILCLSYMLVLPISYLPSLHAMKGTTMLSGCMLLFLILLIFLYSLNLPSSSFPLLNPCEEHYQPPSSCHGTTSFLPVSTWKVLKSFPVFIYTFTCHQNTFTVVNELHHPSYVRINLIFIASIGTALFLCMVICYAGYGTYGNQVFSDILRNYPENSLTTWCRVFVSFIAMCHYPLQLHPARKCALSLWDQIDNLDTSVMTPISDSSRNVSYVALSPLSPSCHATDVEDQMQMKSAETDRSRGKNEQGVMESYQDHLPNEVSSVELQGAGDGHHHHVPSEDTTTSSSSYRIRYLVCTALFNLLTFLIAGCLSDLGLILSLVGASLATLIVYMLPGLFYFILSYHDYPACANHPIWSLSTVRQLIHEHAFKTLSGLGLIGFGMVVMLFSFVTILYDAAINSS